MASSSSSTYKDDIGGLTLSIGLDEASEKTLLAGVKQIISACKLAGLSFEDTKKHLDSFKQAIQASGLKLSDTVLDNLFKRAKMGGESAIETFAKVKLALFGFTAAFQVPKQIYRFAEGIARLNVELKALSYNANMSMATLTTMGGVLGTFGGSAKDVAQSGQKYAIQKQRAMQGQGFGYLQENAWKYGFGFNFAETQEERFVRLIRHMQGMTAERRIALAADEGLSESQKSTALFYAQNGGADAYLARQKSLVRFTEGQEEAAEAGIRLKEATTELSLAWQQFKNNVIVSLAPVVKGLAKVLTVLVGIFSNKVGGVLATILIVTGGLVATFFALMASIVGAKKALWDFALSLKVSSKGNVASGIASAGKKIWGWIAPILASIGSFLAGLLKGGATVAATALKGLVVAIGYVVAILASFAAGLLIGYGLWKAIQKPFEAFINWLMSFKAVRSLLGISEEQKAMSKTEQAKQIEDKGLSSRTIKALRAQGLSDEEIEARRMSAIDRLRGMHDLTQAQAVRMGDYNATHNNTSNTVNNSPTINVSATVTSTGDPEQDGKAIADAAARGIAQYAQSKMSGVKA